MSPPTPRETGGRSRSAPRGQPTTTGQRGRGQRRRRERERAEREQQQHQQQPQPQPQPQQPATIGSGSATTSQGQAASSGSQTGGGGSSAAAAAAQQVEDYKLLLTPMFSAMTKITDNLFLTGVGGMTKKNFRKNHIDFVVNITTEAPFWEDVESMRLPLEDDSSANILPYMDTAVDVIHDHIARKNAHVLVHCVAGVSRSATIVIAYLMKYKRMDLRQAFNYCYQLRPVIRPNNGFMVQLINYEIQLFGRCSVYMVDVEVEGTTVNVPHFFVEEHPKLVLLELMRVREEPAQQQQQQQQQRGGANQQQPTAAAKTTATVPPGGPSVDEQQQIAGGGHRD